LAHPRSSVSADRVGGDAGVGADEVFIGFVGRPVAVARRELEACEAWDCRLDEDTLDMFAGKIAAGERVKIDGGPIRAPSSWTATARSSFPGVTEREERSSIAIAG
jgi:hypothetical protein